MARNFFEKLSNNYLELLDDDEDFNVIINVGETPNSKKFRAHSAVLRYRSLYFRNELVNINRDRNNIKTVNLKHITIQQFEIIIKYIYGGTISLENLDTSFILNLMVITCEFLFEELAEWIENYLIETKDSWLRLNFSDVFQKSFQNDKFKGLQNWCNDIVVKNPEKIFESEDFTSIQENALISLIKRDDLLMKEVKIWNHVIEWGIAQNPGMESDPKNWTNENLLTMKTTLQDCLPHIRYFQICSDDVIDYLQPYQQLLDKNLWDDIIKRNLSPNRSISSVILSPRAALKQTLSSITTEPFSTVINEAHAAEISSWIDKKTYTVIDNPYEFKLLLRGSRDGFTPASFWNLCDKQTNVVVVVKVKDTDEILGGYNPIGWDKHIKSGRFKNCDESFIFSFKNGTIENSILSRVKRPEYAIFCYSGCGPAFGGGSKGCDLMICHTSNQCWNYQGSYEKPIRNASTYTGEFSYFSVDEYEIFQISKKS